MDKFNKQYLPKNLEEMKQTLPHTRSSQNGDEKAATRALLERLQSNRCYEQSLK